MTRSVEVLLNSNIYIDELKSFIKTTLESLSDKIEVEMSEVLSKNTQIVISIVEDRLSSFDEEFFKKYNDREFKFLFYYFRESELDIDDIDEEIFKRIEFKSEVAKDIKLSNDFKELEDLKESIKARLKESISDLINRTNYSKINSFVINRSKGKKFYDSENNLRKVDNYLRREKKISLISGLGGVGKTTLAIEYSVSALSDGIYDYIIWFDVESGIYKEIKKFAIEYLLGDDDGKQEEAYYKRKFSDFLSDFSNSLIILDNYEEDSAFEKELSSFVSEFKRYDIIITSRQIVSKFDIHPIELHVFQDINDALEMFKLTSIRSYSLHEEESIKQIIKLLGNLPLALEITANFLSDSDMSVVEYLEALSEYGLNLFERLEDYTPQNHLEGLKATLKINDRILKDENAFKLLKVFALLSPEEIEKEIVDEYLVKELEIKPFDKVISIKNLEKFSYIKSSKDGYSMHRLLQEAIREEFLSSDDEKVELITKVSLSIFHWFVDSFEESKYGSYFKNTIIHIEYILGEFNNLNIDEAKIYLYTCISAYMEDIGENTKTNLQTIEKAINLLENINVKISDKEKAIIYNQYGRVLKLNLNYREAEETYLKAIELSNDNKIISNIYNNLATTYEKQKKYDEAEIFYEKDLELTTKELGENHLSVAITYHNLAGLYEIQKKYKNSEELYKKSLKIKLEKLGENHPSTSSTYHDLGYLYNKTQKYQQAFKNYFLALKIRLNLELLPIENIENSFIGIKETLTKLKNIHPNQKESINKQIDELNRLFEEKKLKHKIRNLNDRN